MKSTLHSSKTFWFATNSQLDEICSHQEEPRLTTSSLVRLRSPPPPHVDSYTLHVSRVNDNDSMASKRHGSMQVDGDVASINGYMSEEHDDLDHVADDDTEELKEGYETDGTAGEEVQNEDQYYVEGAEEESASELMEEDERGAHSEHYEDDEDQTETGSTRHTIYSDADEAESMRSNDSVCSADVDEAEEDEEEEDEEDEEETTDPAVLEDMEKFQDSFRGIEKRYRLIDKIGEGTFSSVYKAEDLHYDRYDNSWDFEYDSDRRWPLASNRRRGNPYSSIDRRKPKYVAIKKIYVTSSPARIQNELELLHDLSGCDTVVPLITAFRHQDQVVAILPYFKHVDFREYFRSLKMDEIRSYFRSLFSALAHVHEHGIIHRDIKPTNFLYDCHKGRGVLVDFGLAEREGTESSPCHCESDKQDKGPVPPTVSQGYPKHDTRPSRRANRAGTRGFRAPEVLFKCTRQTTKIDIWSAGVILLTILSKRFPFFNSSDDVDAMIEIATIFGKAKMRQCAALHGCVFETTIPTIGEKGFTLEKIVLWATNRTGSGSSSDTKRDEKLPADEGQAIRLLQCCFELDPVKRISAEEALDHEFLYEDDMQMDSEDSGNVQY